MEIVAAGLQKGLKPLIERGADRQSARLQCHIGRERQEIFALVCKGLAFWRSARQSFMRPSGSADRRDLVEGGVTRGNTLHAARDITMAIGACFVRRPSLPSRHNSSPQHPEHARISAVVVLHGAGLGAHEGVTGCARCGDFPTRRQGGGQRCSDNGKEAGQRSG